MRANGDIEGHRPMLSYSYLVVLLENPFCLGLFVLIMLDESLMNLLEGLVGFVNNEVEYFCLMRIMEKGTIGSRTLPISYQECLSKVGLISAYA